jgi:3-deoxy-D-manno-octulosonate cytidylyltransferase
LGVIPARYNSKRFEGKPLAKIKGIPMIKRVYIQCKKSTLLERVVVATDSEKIYDYCKSEEIDVIMTSKDCLTGTDRVAEVSTIIDADAYVNIQGDEPVINPEEIDRIIEEFRKNGDKYLVYNMFEKLRKDVLNPAIVKVIINESSELMYLSRSLIPFNQGNLSAFFNKQVGLYIFTKNALRDFSSHKKTRNEQFEGIEILRYLDLGYKIKMVQFHHESIAVDFPEDVLKVESFLDKNNLD